MKRKLLQAGGALNGVVNVRARAAQVDDGEVTPRFRRRVAALLKQRSSVYRALARPPA